MVVSCESERYIRAQNVTNAKCTILKKSIFYAFKSRRSTLYVLGNKELNLSQCMRFQTMWYTRSLIRAFASRLCDL